MTARVDDCTPSQTLGSGCCGEVFTVSGHGDRVLKQYAAMAIGREFLLRTFRRMAKMPSHPGIETILDHRIDSPPYRSLSLRASGRKLDEIDDRKEAESWTLIRSLAEALAHAHKHGVCHGHLHPGSILVDESEEGAADLTVLDFGTGLVGEIHHIDLGESVFYSAPEQLQSGGRDWSDGHIQKWDVYSFGLIAYRLIHGDAPRGRHFLKRRERQLAHADGRTVHLDIDAFLEEVLADESISWGMRLGVPREHRLYREIIDSCLSLDPAERPVDMREVLDRFRALDHQFALEHAEDRVVKERLKQKGKLIGARSLAAALGVSFFLASYYLVDYLKKTSFFQNKVTELDQVVHTQRQTIHNLDERWAETVTDLKSSREAADAFFQKMASGSAAGGSGVSALKPEDLEKSRVYYLETLDDVGQADTNDLERARALHSLAHIERKLGLTEKAIQHFDDAAREFDDILDRGETEGDTLVDTHLRLADCRENLASLDRNPIGIAALASLRLAVAHFEKALVLDPDNEETVSRQAGTSFLLGRAYDAHGVHDKAVEAYSRSAELATALRDLKPEPPDSLTELIGKLQFNAARSLALLGRGEDAIDAHIASMETLEQLRGVNGFTPLQSIQLASSYIELGILFREREATAEEQDQLYNEALRLLTPLNTADPGDVEVAILLCRSLIRLGHLEREQGRWSAGYRLSVRGIESLKVALEAHETAHVPGYCRLAEARLEHLEFLTSEEESARTVATRGVETAEIINKALADSEIDEPLLSDHRRRLGAIFRSYADICEGLGETELARVCREKAAMQIAAVLPTEDLLLE